MTEISEFIDSKHPTVVIAINIDQTEKDIFTITYNPTDGSYQVLQRYGNNIKRKLIIYNKENVLYLVSGSKHFLPNLIYIMYVLSDEIDGIESRRKEALRYLYFKMPANLEEAPNENPKDFTNCMLEILEFQANCRVVNISK